MISCDSETKRGASLGFFCIKQKKTGELCCGVITVAGYADNRLLNILFKVDKGALHHPNTPSRPRPPSMCFVFSTCGPTVSLYIVFQKLD